MTDKPRVVVAAGVILNPRKTHVLLSFRHTHLDQGGLWEYPGGKVEVGEAITTALARELKEELAIEPLDSCELCTVKHDYGKKVVELHFYVVASYSGEPTSMESQRFDWWQVGGLSDVAFPEANQGVSEQLSQWLKSNP